MKSKFYIISGNFDEADEWVKKDLARPIPHRVANPELVSEYKYIPVGYNQLLVLLTKVNPIHGVFVGTWRERKDLNDIIKTIRYANKLPDTWQPEGSNQPVEKT
jgi:hypothetical protein